MAMKVYFKIKKIFNEYDRSDLNGDNMLPVKD
jgi:hypothetical protein